MSDWNPFSWVGDLISLPFQAFNASQNRASQERMMEAQIQMQKDINDQNIAFARSENEINRQREDSALQRSRADAEKAGFSPLAGIGGASSTYASLPQAQSPDISGFASNIASIANNSSSQIADTLSSLGEKLTDMPVRSLQLEGLISDNKKKSADASSAVMEALHTAHTLSSRIGSTNAKHKLDQYITKVVTDLNLIPSGFSSGVPNLVKQGLDGLKNVGEKIDEQVDETMKAVDKAKKGKKLDKTEKRRVEAYNDYRKFEESTFPLPF